MKRLLFTTLTIASLLSLGFLPSPTQYSLQLQVPALAQSWSTSCGEAVIVMAYNYQYPQTPLKEADVIQYAIRQGYFSPGAAPFTSPANMVKLVQRYTKDFATGNVTNPADGLELLNQKLQQGQPIIIDLTTHLDRPGSAAHFVLVTGLVPDPNNAQAATVYFNNPLTGLNESAAWDGETGVWNAWQNNGDPGGAGWWLAISAP